jgi:hypothetical protein
LEVDHIKEKIWGADSDSGMDKINIHIKDDLKKTSAVFDDASESQIDVEACKKPSKDNPKTLMEMPKREVISDVEKP